MFIKQYIALLSGIFCITNLTGSNTLDFHADSFDCITSTNVALSGFYSDKGTQTPQVPVFHNYNPEDFSRVMLGLKTPTNAELSAKLKAKLKLPDMMPVEMYTVIQRRSYTGEKAYDLGTLRPHYALFDVKPHDARVTGKFNASDKVTAVPIFPVLGGNVSIKQFGGISAHPGGKSTVLSPNNLCTNSFGENDYLFFTLTKTTKRTLLSLHYIPSKTNQKKYESALLMAKQQNEYDPTFKGKTLQEKIATILELSCTDEALATQILKALLIENTLFDVLEKVLTE